MIEKTVEQIEDENFEKWWARHPWRVVKVGNQKFVHINFLNVCSIVCVMAATVPVLELIDISRWEDYKKEKIQLSEKQLKEKYSNFQIFRYEALSTLQEKMK